MKEVVPQREIHMQEVLERIHGIDIYQQLVKLAKIGGHEVDPFPDMLNLSHFAPSRLSLTSKDMEGREFVQNLMVEVGLQVDDSHPLGIVGKLEGSDPDAKPIIIMSHYDTVPEADMFDGVTGILSGIAVAKAIKESEAHHDRPIWILGVTDEESARFKRALFGSDSMFNGLSDKTIDSTYAEGIAMRQAIVDMGLDIEDVKKSFFDANEIDSVIELHVSQTGQLPENADIGLIEAIAAPQRFEITVGNELEPDTSEYPFSDYVQIDIQGVAGHSGATPMHLRARADGLPPLGEIVGYLHDLTKDINDSSISISIGDISIENQALNKIPGHTQAIIRVSGNDQPHVDSLMRLLNEYIEEMNPDYETAYPPFPDSPITLRKMETHEIVDNSIQFYEHNASSAAHELACGIALNIQHIAEKYKDEHVVGTVGTYTIRDGQIILGVDVRGIDKGVRDYALAEMWKAIHEARAQSVPSVPFEYKVLDGSGDPVTMDGAMVDFAEEVIQKYNIGTVVRTNSAAGHDAMNVATAGIPTLLMFIRDNGIAHNPGGFTSPKEIEKGARALAAVVLERANR